MIDLIDKNEKEKVVNIKAIFLDVDGVLNCQDTEETCGDYIGIEDTKVILLKQIIDATGAIIILVSSWKEGWISNPNFKITQDELATYLDEKLAKQGLVIKGKTFDGNSDMRGKGIIRFIDKQKEIGINIDKYIILDDEMFDYLEVDIARHLIKTSFCGNGLELEHVKRAIEALAD